VDKRKSALEIERNLWHSEQTDGGKDMNKDLILELIFATAMFALTLVWILKS
jgi:hypothetical protein